MRTVIAIALGAALGAGGFAPAQHDKHGDAAKVKSLLEQDVSERIDGKEARVSVLEVSYGPGGFTPPHRHPGEVFGHVLEGELEAQLEGQPLRKLKAGDTFYEPTMAHPLRLAEPEQDGEYAAPRRQAIVVVEFESKNRSFS